MPSWALLLDSAAGEFAAVSSSGSANATKGDVVASTPGARRSCEGGGSGVEAEEAEALPSPGVELFDRELSQRCPGQQLVHSFLAFAHGHRVL